MQSHFFVRIWNLAYGTLFHSTKMLNGVNGPHFVSHNDVFIGIHKKPKFILINFLLTNDCGQFLLIALIRFDDVERMAFTENGSWEMY